MGGRRLRSRFWVETGLAALSGILVVMTIIWNDWAELIFGIDPDEGNGSFEVAVTLIAVALTILFAFAARIEWRRAEAARS
jgi:hypothetical protein